MRISVRCPLDKSGCAVHCCGCLCAAVMSFGARVTLRHALGLLQEHLELRIWQLTPALWDWIQSTLVILRLRLEHDPSRVVQSGEEVLLLRPRRCCATVPPIFDQTLRARSEPLLSRLQRKEAVDDETKKDSQNQ